VARKAKKIAAGKDEHAKGKLVIVNDKMRHRYRYRLSAPIGRNFETELQPQLTLAEMLRLGVFCGKYLTDCRKEFPPSWFAHAKLAARQRNCALKCFGADASQPANKTLKSIKAFPHWCVGRAVLDQSSAEGARCLGFYR
jgi:hypothetical protein